MAKSWLNQNAVKAVVTALSSARRTYWKSDMK